MTHTTRRKPKLPKGWKEVHFDIAPNAFDGPFACHRRQTVLAKKQMVLAGQRFDYEVWECPKCHEEYPDAKQAPLLEQLWRLQRLLETRRRGVPRKLDFDGKSYSVRFPAALTKRWKKESKAQITRIRTDEFLVKIKG